MAVRVRAEARTTAATGQASRLEVVPAGAVFEVLPVKNGLRGKMTFGEGFLNLLKSKALR